MGRGNGRTRHGGEGTALSVDSIVEVNTRPTWQAVTKPSRSAVDLPPIVARGGNRWCGFTRKSQRPAVTRTQLPRAVSRHSMRQWL